METLMTRFLLRLASLIAVLAFAGGCSNYLFGIIQNFGLPNGPKISTAVGNGTGGYKGDGGPATSAEINQPYGIAEDSSGNLYIADSRNCVIRKVDTSGNITTVAGNGSPGYSSSGLATNANLNSPLAVVLDSAGDMYISDAGNYVIQKVDHVTQDISTVAGMPGATGWNDSTPLTATLGTTVKLGYPYGLALDSGGNLYIADLYNSVIWMLNTSGNITTVAGSHSLGAGYAGDGGQATSSELNYPMGVWVDAVGDIYIADSSNYAIRKVTPSGIITTMAGTGTDGFSGDGGPATSAEINFPADLTMDSAGNLYISEGDSIVRKIDTSGIISMVAGNYNLGAGYGGDGNVATAALLYDPFGLAFDPSGNLFIADRVNDRIRKVGLGH
jgi:sugar lactone lactonase YvrE